MEKCVLYAKITRGMKRGMTIAYLKCRANLNFEVIFRVNGAIGAIGTKWDLGVDFSFSYII